MASFNTNQILGIAIAVIAASVTLGLLAGVLPGLWSSGAEITESFNGTDVGDEQANSILQAVKPLVPIFLIFGVLGLVFGVMKFRRG